MFFQAASPVCATAHFASPALAHYATLARRGHLALEGTAVIAHFRGTAEAARRQVDTLLEP
jgi:hypothetical protein